MGSVCVLLASVPPVDLVPFPPSSRRSPSGARRPPNTIRVPEALRALYLGDPDAWILPWAILPEVDYLTATTLGDRAEQAWLDDLANGRFAVEWGTDRDLPAAYLLVERYQALRMGLVDAVVMIVAERLTADIATLDLRHFDTVRLKHSPRLFPRDSDPQPRRARRKKSS